MNRVTSSSTRRVAVVDGAPGVSALPGAEGSRGGSMGALAAGDATRASDKFPKAAGAPRSIHDARNVVHRRPIVFKAYGEEGPCHRAVSSDWPSLTWIAPTAPRRPAASALR